jgi:uncharacterized SAM-binding protein YcdF (DUF218 family)
MSQMLDAVKWIDAPGSTAFFVLCCVLAVPLAVIWPRRRAVVAAWMGLVALLYVTLAMPFVANSIAAELPALPRAAWSNEPRIHTLVVFDGDNRNGRVREARRLYDLAHPSAVWSLGWEPWMEDALKRAGIDGSRVRHDQTTTTTREQVQWVRRWIDQHGDAAGVTIVASRLQAPRIAALLRIANVNAVLAVAETNRENEIATSGWRQFVPTVFALHMSRDAIYEHASLAYYRHHGWIQ